MICRGWVSPNFGCFNPKFGTITKILQKHRGKSSTEYLGFLRTRELIQQIKDNPKLLQHSQDALATNFGFGSVKTMSRQFKENAKMNVGFFLKEAERTLNEEVA